MAQTDKLSALVTTLMIGVAVVVFMMISLYFTTPKITTKADPVEIKNDFTVSSKAHVKDVICRYTITSTDTLYTISMVDACSKWDVNQPVIFKQQ